MLTQSKKRLPPDRLTDTVVTASCPQDRPYKLGDGHGLFILVNPNGVKLWRWNYYRPSSGKRNTLSLGSFPSVTVLEARRLRDVARGLLADGVDPGHRRKENRAADKMVRAAPFMIDSDGTLTVNLPGRHFRLAREDAEMLRDFLVATRGVGTSTCR